MSTSGAQLACSFCGNAVRAGDSTCATCGARITGNSGSIGSIGSIGGIGAPITDPLVHATFTWDAVVARLRQLTAGDYDVLAELGRGGMAAVFLAHEHALNRKVALKVMSPALMMGSGMVERFRQEARTQASLSHANIVAVHGVRQRDDLHFFVMQYVPGRSLQQVIRACRTGGVLLPFPVVRALVYQIGAAVAFAHRKGVIHRDIKPANILLNADGEAVVTDFGIAKVAEIPSQTMTGTVVGTPQYMSPEQCYAAELTGASDQYSLGVVAYELLTGRPPFTGSTFVVMQAHTLEQVPPVASLRPDCPPDLQAAVHRMLEKKKDNRFPSVMAALAALGATPTPSDEDDPVRRALIELADLTRERARRGDVPTGRTPPSVPDLVKPPRDPQSVPPISEPSPGDGARAAQQPPANPSAATPQPVTPTPTPLPETVIAHRRGAEPSADGRTPDSRGGDGSAAEPHDGEDSVVRLQLSDPPARIEVGETVQLHVAAMTGAGREVESPSVSWKSSNARVASIGAATGLLEARSAGAVDVVVSCGDAVAIVRLSVREATIADIHLEQPPDVVEVGDSVSLVGYARDKRGQRLNRAVRWSVRDTAVAEIDSGATLRARAPGMALVAGIADGVRGEWRIRVDSAHAVRLEISGPDSMVGVDEQVRLYAKAFDKRGDALPAAAIAWTTLTPGVADVSGVGAVRGVSRGRAVIEARCDNASVTTQVTVGVVPLATLEVEGVINDLTVGSSRPVSARAIDTAGRVRDLPIEWTSTHPEVAAIEDGSTLVARAVGDAVLRARCGSIERSFLLTVVPAVTLGDRVRKVSGKLRAVDGDATPPRTGVLIAAVVGVAVLAMAGFAMTRGSAEVAVARTDSLVADGVVQPSKPELDTSDTSRDPASPDTLPDSKKVISDPAPPDSEPVVVPPVTPPVKPPVGSPPVVERIRIVSATRTIEVSDSLRLTAEVSPRAAASSSPVAWRSQNSDIATVNARSGLVTGVRPGTAAIEARAGQQVQRISVLVEPPRVVALALTGGRNLLPSETLTLSLAATSARGASLPTAEARWTSTRTDVATVDATGVVRAVAAGTTTIIVDLGGRTAQQNIQVDEAPKPADPPPPPVRNNPPAPVEKSEPPAPPSPIAALGDAVAQCQSAIRGFRTPAGQQPFAGGTAEERSNATKLSRLANSGLAVGQVGAATEPVVNYARAFRAFTAEVSWKDFAGRSQRQQLQIHAAATLASGQWSFAGCHIQGKPRLD